MTIENEFRLLTVGDIRASENSLVTRPVETATAHGQVLLAVDVQARRHVLLPYDKRVGEKHVGKVAYLSRVLGNDGETYLDVWCEEPDLMGTFAAFAEHLLGTVSVESEAYVTLRRALEDWKSLLSPQKGMDTHTAIGLIGELELLSKLASRDPVVGWRVWTGPRGQVHDFTSAAIEVEVKSTLSADAGLVTIHGLDQLDPGDRPLHLLINHVRWDPAAPRLDDRLDQLVALGVGKRELLEVVAALGHPYQSDQEKDEHRYLVRSTSHWRVTEDFPGLRRSRLGETSLDVISRVSYALSEAGLPAPLPPTAMAYLVEDLLS